MWVYVVRVQKRMGEKKEKKASTGGNQALLKRRLDLAVWEDPLGRGF